MPFLVTTTPASPINHLLSLQLTLLLSLHGYFTSQEQRELILSLLFLFLEIMMSGIREQQEV